MRDTYIPFDLESTPLQIKTDSPGASGNNEQINIRPYTADGSAIGELAVKFTSPMKYQIEHCQSKWAEFTVQPPEEVDKIWTFQKTASILSTRKPIGVLQQSPIPHLSSSPIRDNIPAPYIINKPGFI